MPEGTLIKAMDYAHKNAECLIKEIALEHIERYHLDKSAVLEIVGYPSEGYDKLDEQQHFNLTTLILLDRDKTGLGGDLPCVGIQIDTEYRIKGDSHVLSMGPNSSVITARRTPLEIELMMYLKTGGKPLYKVRL